jgi:hypothetical protein
MSASVDFHAFDDHRSPRQLSASALSGAVAVAFGAFASVWAYHAFVASPLRVAQAPTLAAAPATPQKTAVNPDGVFFEAQYSSNLSPALFARGFANRSILEPFAAAPSAVIQEPPAPLAASSPATPEPQSVPPVPTPVVSELAEAPLPPPRPSEFAAPAKPLVTPPVAPVVRAAPLRGRQSPAAAPIDNRSFFEKLFGLSQPSRPAAPGSAYAAPESGVVNVARTTAVTAPRGAVVNVNIARTEPAAVSGRYDKFTAVYDLTARTVYMPDGTRLEAHSGLGDRLDDPRYVSERMHGPTPPHLYELTAREQLFHGVAALRLNPIGGGELFGRAGLLAHSFMLGPNGDSNGCVSFRDYEAFLRAFQSGQVKRLAVVASM